jgi:hypothetical protein
MQGGGIVPDIEMKDDVNWKQPGIMQWMDIISEYAIRYNLKVNGGKIISPDNIDAIHSTLPSKKETLSAIDSLAAKRTTKGGLDTLMTYQAQHEEDLFRIAQSTLIAYRTGEEGWYRAYNEQDPVILKAKDVVKLDLMMALNELKVKN